MSRFKWLLLVGAVSLFAGILHQDRRNAAAAGANTHVTMRTYATLEEWQTRRVELRRQILVAAGLYPLPVRTPLNPRRFSRVRHDGYSVERVLLETLPGYYLGANLYLPAGAVRHAPAVLIPHGHWKHGRVEDNPSYSVPRLAANLARQGLVAFAWDMVGYNDTRQTRHEFGSTGAEELWDYGPLGLQLWNSIRALDFVQSLAEVDPARIAVTGASGGATQTMLLSAIDDRVTVSAPVAMISAYFQGDCSCENAPGLRVGTNNLEIAALMAPRPMLLVSATGDWTRHVPAEEFPEIQKIYALYGKAANVQSAQIHARHNYNGASRSAVYRFLQQYLIGNADPHPPVEPEREVFTGQDLLISPVRPLPPGALNGAGVFSEWRRQSSQENQTLDAQTLRERLALAMGVTWPGKVLTSGEDGDLVLTRPGEGDRVPAVWLPGDAERVAIVIHPDGSGAARGAAETRDLQHDGYRVLLVDAYQTGRARESRHGGDRFYLTYQHSVDASRVQDILTALAYAHSLDPAELRLVGLDRAALWTTFAAAVAPVPVILEADTARYNGTDQEFERDFFVPGIQWAGGLEAARRVLASPARSSVVAPQ